MPRAKRSRSVTRTRPVVKRRRLRGPFKAPRRNRLQHGSQGVYSFSRIVSVPGIITTATVTSNLGKREIQIANGTSANFKLLFDMASITQWTEISSLFEYYKVQSITYTWDFAHNMSNFTAAGTTSAYGNYLPEINWVLDRDNHAIGTYPDITQMQGVRKFKFGERGRRSVSMTYRPNIYNLVNDTLSNTTYVPIRAPWCETSNSSVKFGGISGTLFNFDGDTHAGFILSARVKFLCRLVK